MKTRIFILFLALGIIIGIKTNRCTNSIDPVACTNKPVNIDIGSINATPSKASILLSLQSVHTSMNENFMIIDPHIANNTASHENLPALSTADLGKTYLALQPPLQ